jgi:hypothetical protein
MCEVDGKPVKAKSKVEQLTEAIDRLTAAVERLDRATRGTPQFHPWPNIKNPWGGGFPGQRNDGDPPGLVG